MIPIFRRYVSKISIICRKCWEYDFGSLKASASSVQISRDPRKQGENGFLVELYDNYALANQILRIFEDYDSMKIIKEEAFNTVIKDFDLENNLVKFKNSFYDVIG